MSQYLLLLSIFLDISHQNGNIKYLSIIGGFPSIIYLFNTGCHIQILPNICKPIIKFFLSIAFFHFKPPVKINLFAGKVCRPILGVCGTKYTACSRKFKAGALYGMFTIEILTSETNSEKNHA